MFDINSRMEQWSAANHAQHTEDIKKALETPAQPPQTEEVTKSAGVAERAKPFIKSEGPHFNIDARVDAWNRTERAGDTATFESLTKSNPFKKAEEPSEIVEQLMNESPEALIELAEECIDELESRGTSEGPAEETSEVEIEEKSENDGKKEEVKEEVETREEPEEPSDDEKKDDE